MINYPIFKTLKWQIRTNGDVLIIEPWTTNIVWNRKKSWIIRVKIIKIADINNTRDNHDAGLMVKRKQ